MISAVCAFAGSVPASAPIVTNEAMSRAVRMTLLDCDTEKDHAIEDKYLLHLTARGTIYCSVRRNIARYANHGCRPNAESDVQPRKRKVYIRAIKTIQPGDEITYDYGSDYFKE